MNPPHCPDPDSGARPPSARVELEEPRPGAPCPPRRSVWLWLLVAAQVPLAWLCGDTLAVAQVPEPAAPAQVAAEPDAGTEPTATDTSPGGVLATQAGRPLPRNPERWQKVARCLEDVEERLHGACYVRAARKPPCPPALFEYAAACFVAVAKSKRPDTSVDEVPW